MSQTQSDLVWLRDLLEHLMESQEKLEWLRDAPSAHYLTQAMLRELECCRKLCVKLNRRAVLAAAN